MVKTADREIDKFRFFSFAFSRFSQPVVVLPMHCGKLDPPRLMLFLTELATHAQVVLFQEIVLDAKTSIMASVSAQQHFNPRFYRVRRLEDYSALFAKVGFEKLADSSDCGVRFPEDNLASTKCVTWLMRGPNACEALKCCEWTAQE